MGYLDIYSVPGVEARILLVSVRAVQGMDAPYIFRGGGESKVGAADFGQRPLSSTRDAQPMNSQLGKLSVLPGRVKTGGVTPVVYDGPFLRLH